MVKLAEAERAVRQNQILAAALACFARTGYHATTMADVANEAGVSKGTPYLYFTIAFMLFLTYMLFRTRWGLRLRASGEKPSAAGTVGIDVIKIRYRSMIMAGAIAGLAGSYLSLSSAGSFQMGMSAGKGFIALAAVIFGAWHPIGAFGAALVFGFADAIQSLLSILGVDVPPQVLNSVPYIVTIIVVAGVVGRVRGPAAAGQPYDQG